MRWGGLRCVAASRRAASSPVGCLAALLGPPRASAGRRSSRRGSGRWVGWRSNADRRSRRIASPPARLDGVPLRTFASRLQKYILVPWSAGTVRAEGFAVPSVCATGPPCRLRRHFSSLPAGKDQRLGATPGDEPVGAATCRPTTPAQRPPEPSFATRPDAKRFPARTTSGSRRPIARHRRLPPAEVRVHSFRFDLPARY